MRAAGAGHVGRRTGRPAGPLVAAVCAVLAVAVPAPRGALAAAAREFQGAAGPRCSVASTALDPGGGGGRRGFPARLALPSPPPLSSSCRRAPFLTGAQPLPHLRPLPKSGRSAFCCPVDFPKATPSAGTFH